MKGRQESAALSAHWRGYPGCWGLALVCAMQGPGVQFFGLHDGCESFTFQLKNNLILRQFKHVKLGLSFLLALNSAKAAIFVILECLEKIYRSHENTLFHLPGDFAFHLLFNFSPSLDPVETTPKLNTEWEWAHSTCKDFLSGDAVFNLGRTLPVQWEFKWKAFCNKCILGVYMVIQSITFADILARMHYKGTWK